MRISDWSSDVCSSDLDIGEGAGARRLVGRQRRAVFHAQAPEIGAQQLGRASCRERVCQYVSISVVAVSVKKNITHSQTYDVTHTQQSKIRHIGVYKVLIVIIKYTTKYETRKSL